MVENADAEVRGTRGARGLEKNRLEKNRLEKKRLEKKRLQDMSVLSTKKRSGLTFLWAKDPRIFQQR